MDSTGAIVRGRPYRVSPTALTGYATALVDGRRILQRLSREGIASLITSDQRQDPTLAARAVNASVMQDASAAVALATITAAPSETHGKASRRDLGRVLEGRGRDRQRRGKNLRLCNDFRLTGPTVTVTVSQENETETGDKAMARKELTKAVAYLRTSSAANVGADKDSERRQRDAITAFAKRGGFDLVDWFNDAAVSGADPIEARPGFSALLDRIETNGVRTVIVEDASRFARDLITQELGIIALIGRGVRVLTATGDDLTETTDPFKVAMRQIAGAFAQLEKARLVAKLRGARERKRATGVKVEGRKSYAETNPEMVALARKLHRYPVNGRRRSLREIAAEMSAQGFTASSGKPFGPEAVKRMVGA